VNRASEESDGEEGHGEASQSRIRGDLVSPAGRFHRHRLI
jgi:hypothetical protein